MEIFSVLTLLDTRIGPNTVTWPPSLHFTPKSTSTTNTPLFIIWTTLLLRVSFQSTLASLNHSLPTVFQRFISDFSTSIFKRPTCNCSHTDGTAPFYTKYHQTSCDSRTSWVLRPSQYDNIHRLDVERESYRLLDFPNPLLLSVDVIRSALPWAPVRIIWFQSNPRRQNKHHLT